MAVTRGAENPTTRAVSLQVLKPWEKGKGNRELTVQQTFSFSPKVEPDSTPVPHRRVSISNFAGPVGVIGKNIFSKEAAQDGVPSQVETEGTAPLQDTAEVNQPPITKVIVRARIKALSAERARRRHDALVDRITVTDDADGNPQVSIRKRPLGAIGRLFAPRVEVAAFVPESVPTALDLSTQDEKISVSKVLLAGSNLRTVTGEIAVSSSRAEEGEVLRTHTDQGQVVLDRVTADSINEIAQEGSLLGYAVVGETMVTGGTVKVKMWEPKGTYREGTSGGSTHITGLPPKREEQTEPVPVDAQEPLSIHIKTGGDVTVDHAKVDADIVGGNVEADEVALVGPNSLVATVGDATLNEVGTGPLRVTAISLGENNPVLVKFGNPDANNTTTEVVTAFRGPRSYRSPNATVMAPRLVTVINGAKAA